MNISRTIRIILPLAFAILAIAAVAQDQAVPAKPVTEEVVATPAPKQLTELEMANLKLAFEKAKSAYTQAVLDVTSIRAKVGEETLKQLQDAMAKVQPALDAARSALQPLQATCKAGETFSPDAGKCETPQGQQPVAPPVAKKPAPGKK